MAYAPFCVEDFDVGIIKVPNQIRCHLRRNILSNGFTMCSV